jgi:hypothetical protein
MILVKEFSGVSFRNEILRGVRLFMIAFSAVLIGVWVYRILHAPPDVQGAGQNVPAAYEPAQPEQEPAPAAVPVADASSEPHGLVVPPPPPVGGTSPSKVARPRFDVPPPPPAVVPIRPSRAPAVTGREFEVAEVGVMPPAPKKEESATAGEVPTKKEVGYKSLVEVNANRPPPLLEPAAQAPVESAAEKTQKGNRFSRAMGKIFHPGQKEATPLTLQPKQQ